jgi:hypothetical protein
MYVRTLVFCGLSPLRGFLLIEEEAYEESCRVPPNLGVIDSSALLIRGHTDRKGRPRGAAIFPARQNQPKTCLISVPQYLGR